MKSHNFYGHIQRVVSPATPDTTFAVAHGMGVTPRGYIIARRTNPLASLSRSASVSGLNTGANFIAGWEFENGSALGTDSGSNGLTLVNNGVTQVAGVVGNAISCVATSSQYLSRASEALLQTGDIDFTFAAWVKATTKTAFMFAVAKDTNTGGAREYGLYYDPVLDRFRMGVYRAVDTLAPVSADALGAVTTGVWYFLVGWHNAAADTVSIQVNNGVVNSAATGGALQAAGGAEFRIGGRATPGSGLYWNGLLDQVMFWKRVLSSTERTGLYNSGAGVTVAEAVSPTTTLYTPAWDDTYAYFKCSQGNAEFYVLFFV